MDGDSNKDSHISTNTSTNAKDTRRDTAIDRLTYRLAGYVVIQLITYTIPGICSCILDSPDYIYTESFQFRLLDSLAVINGLEGALNGICSLFDPAMLVVHRLSKSDFCRWLAGRDDQVSQMLLSVLHTEQQERRRYSTSGLKARSDLNQSSIGANTKVRIIASINAAPAATDENS